jgi:hypothetical protein
MIQIQSTMKMAKATTKVAAVKPKTAAKPKTTAKSKPKS